MTEEEKQHLQTQCALSRSLSLGFVLTVIPAFGIVSLVIGARAASKIEASGNKLTGAWMAKWCVVVGLVESIVTIIAVLGLISVKMTTLGEAP